MRSVSLLAMAVFLANVAVADERGRPPAKSDPVGARAVESAPSKLIVPTKIAMPTAIPPSEHVEGFHLSEPALHLPPGSTSTSVYVASIERTGETWPEGNGPCVISEYPSGEDALNWGNVSQHITEVEKHKGKQGSFPTDYRVIQALRRDELRDVTATTLSLNVKFALIDPHTRGVRLHSEQTLPFTKVKQFPLGVSVWLSLSETEALFLVKSEVGRFAPFLGLSSAAGRSETQIAMSGCPLVVPVRVGRGLSELRVAELDVVTTAVDSPRTGGPNDRAPGSAFSEIKVRTMRIGLSSSWLSQDTAPLLSVTYGWATDVRKKAGPVRKDPPGGHDIDLPLFAP